MAGIAPDADLATVNWRELFDDKIGSTNATLPFRRFWPTAIGEGETRLRNLQTGQTRDLHVTAFQVEDPRTGTLLCLATVQRDITASKRAARSCGRVSGRFSEMMQRVELNFNDARPGSPHHLLQRLSFADHGLATRGIARPELVCTVHPRKTSS